MSEALQAARATLEPLPGGWRLDSARADGQGGVIVRLAHPSSALGVDLEWWAVADAPARPAFARGPVHAAAYRRGPGVYDVDREGTPDIIVALAHAACRLLAESQTPWETHRGRAYALPPEPWPDDPIDRLVHALGHLLMHGPSPAPGFEVRSVSAARHWRRVAEVALVAGDRSLTFIVHPRDDQPGARPPFRRGAHVDLVYYSDDLAESDHDQLYRRDQAAIEEMTAWLLGWDAALGAALL